MLYDNGQLAATYLDAFCLTGKASYARVARGILDYLRRDMTHPDGGIFSAEAGFYIPCLHPRQRTTCRPKRSFLSLQVCEHRRLCWVSRLRGVVIIRAACRQHAMDEEHLEKVLTIGLICGWAQTATIQNLRRTHSSVS